MRSSIKKIIKKFGYTVEDGRLVSYRKINKFKKEIFKNIDMNHYERLISSYWNEAEIKKAKYNEILFIRIALRLRLDLKSSLKILDLGGKAGTFAFVCNRLGHNAWSSDIFEMLNRSPNPELHSLYGVPMIEINIQPNSPINYTGRKYDLISGIRTRFHSTYPWETGNKYETHWSVNEWKFFLNDLANNHLKENGRIYFLLGRCQEKSKGGGIPLDLKKYFLSVGAKIDGKHLLIHNSDLLKNN